MLHCQKLRLLSMIIVFLVFIHQFIQANDSLYSDNEPFISGIILNGDSVIFSYSDTPEPGHFLANDHILKYNTNNILFELKPAGIFEYQFFLEGFDEKPTKWLTNDLKEYTNLPAGRYSFHVRFRDSDGRSGELDPLVFRILPLWYLSAPAIISYPVLLLLSFLAFYQMLKRRFDHKQFLLEQLINKKTEEMITDKEKTEKLLANVLPKDTADEIMEKGKATKMKYNFVTVLFSDIQGFTQIAEEMNPEVLIDELDKFFFHFDSVVEKYRIEKIKTIGDAYMCAGGIPEKNRTNPVEVILAALEMQTYMKKIKESAELAGIKFWDIRIGIHTGTVIAGVVGQKKLSYDIWGDTVNTASRMESSGEAGKINISGTTYEFVKEYFICEYRGRMPVKYKGELDMYFVKGIVAGLCDENGTPNRNFILKIQMIKLQDIEEMINKLYSEEASPNLYFHNPAHLRNLCSQVDLLTKAENLPDDVYINLKLASIFLLTGFAADYDKPEDASFNLLEDVLPRYGFNRENIESAENLIRNSFNDHPESLSDKILHDARYDYLGRVDYITLTDKLFRERIEYGKVTDNKTWYDIQKKLLYDHEFLTSTGKLLRSVSMEDQISALEVYTK
jgi:class 3 adenylate cyclase